MNSKSALLTRLSDSDDRAAWGLTQTLITQSHETDEWSDCLDVFASLLYHKKSLVRNRGLLLLAANAKWDDEHQLDSILDDCLDRIQDEKPVTARQCLKALEEIAQAQPQYSRRIAAALQHADFFRYKESMRSLLEQDRSRILDLLISIQNVQDSVLKETVQNEM